MSMPRPHHGAMDAVVGIACPCLNTTRNLACTVMSKVVSHCHCQ